MNREEILRRIRAKIAAGVLPGASAHQIWGGSGSGEVCAACDRVIDPEEAEIEADCVDEVTRHYHAACHLLVEAERGKTPR